MTLSVTSDISGSSPCKCWTDRLASTAKRLGVVGFCGTIAWAKRHAYVDQHRLGELEARLGRLRHRVGDAELVERAGVLGVAGARHQCHVPTEAARDRDHRLVGAGRIHCHYHRARGLEAAAAQIVWPRSVAVIDPLAG